ncbi:hypothetical protein ACFR9U_09375 [Halorientalis brevis]|uniref:Uncharacterized protein n=1 Tax=Halorientalis brevis TaxID=1126241 RepID=A0ABD6CBL6_9EURY|nr:hypothetical protein [Halorientalis brevis]
MEIASQSPLIAATLIVLGTLVASPAVGLVDFTDNRQSQGELGTGNVTVTEASLPSSAGFEKGQYGSESYYLRVPAATVTFERVTGRPVLNYKLDVPGLSYSRQSVYFVDESDSGERVTFKLNKDTLPPETFTREEYTGEVRLVMRANGSARVLANRTITVEVRE